MLEEGLFLFVESQETSRLQDLRQWLPAGLKCDQWEIGSNVWMCLAIATDAIDQELVKREVEGTLGS